MPATIPAPPVRRRFRQDLDGAGGGLPGDRGSLTVFESRANARVLWVDVRRRLATLMAAWLAAVRQELPHVMVERLACRSGTRLSSRRTPRLYVVGVGAGREYSDLGAERHDPSVRSAPRISIANGQTTPGFGATASSLQPPRGATISYSSRRCSRRREGRDHHGDGRSVRTLTGPGSRACSGHLDLNRRPAAPRGLGDPTSQELRRSLPGPIRRRQPRQAQARAACRGRGAAADRLGRLR